MDAALTLQYPQFSTDDKIQAIQMLLERTDDTCDVLRSKA